MRRLSAVFVVLCLVGGIPAQWYSTASAHVVQDLVIQGQGSQPITVPVGPVPNSGLTINTGTRAAPTNLTLQRRALANRYLGYRISAYARLVTDQRGPQGHVVSLSGRLEVSFSAPTRESGVLVIVPDGRSTNINLTGDIELDVDQDGIGDYSALTGRTVEIPFTADPSGNSVWVNFGLSLIDSPDPGFGSWGLTETRSWNLYFLPRVFGVEIFQAGCYRDLEVTRSELNGRAVFSYSPGPDLWYTRAVLLISADPGQIALPFNPACSVLSSSVLAVPPNVNDGRFEKRWSLPLIRLPAALTAYVQVVVLPRGSPVPISSDIYQTF